MSSADMVQIPTCNRHTPIIWPYICATADSQLLGRSRNTGWARTLAVRFQTDVFPVEPSLYGAWADSAIACLLRDCSYQSFNGRRYPIRRKHLFQGCTYWIVGLLRSKGAEALK
ncbi:predicted protein [Aspergillus nidulans FGSC A4]|uniref:Uncharacterized protein n=1 Tax=Emericella nidulans (strain FGSC A4 / ATCC 38163 / CBS 112.46 / NRRL 194 / M139) TaxID=227321 RepID=Q5AUQ6_EMENI|nr:hypothetical protein [Aspergillus nidulans FGSC A4]EAA59628.1 predicted protein [Aspergillus nidulans FGSC A4]CBF73629.1 TPA: conserved hypothetical protein [Aspergillus nidulans FGSC A4]|eukprot:XP_681243.1 predicted protein [Aspergillus nidulans FGSC A4]